MYSEDNVKNAHAASLNVSLEFAHFLDEADKSADSQFDFKVYKL